VKQSMLSVLEFMCAKLSIITLLLMALVTFCDVFGRVVFNAPIGFAYELVGIFLAISFYAGLYHVHKTSKHIRIDLFEGLFKGRWGCVTLWFGFLVEVLFFGTLIVMVFKQQQETQMFGETFMFLGFDKSIILSIMLGLAAIAFVSLIITTPLSAKTYLESEKGGDR
jgi:TRAP-type C4-dicarboxylate transport system permease small subunit